MKKKHINLSQEDAWRIYELLEQMHSFLHQQENYKDSERVSQWLDNGVYTELKEAYYKITGAWFPVDEESGRVLPPPGVKRRFLET